MMSINFQFFPINSIPIESSIKIFQNVETRPTSTPSNLEQDRLQVPQRCGHLLSRQNPTHQSQKGWTQGHCPRIPPIRSTSSRCRKGPIRPQASARHRRRKHSAARSRSNDQQNGNVPRRIPRYHLHHDCQQTLLLRTRVLRHHCRQNQSRNDRYRNRSRCRKHVLLRYEFFRRS
jgi:hypothetical protein